MSEPRYSRERDAIGRWWCAVHNRWATHLLQRQGIEPEHVCDPALGGITMPCDAVEFSAPSSSLRPSFFVATRRDPECWGRVTVCGECRVVGAYEDAHPAEPCRRCGSAVSEDVGRWVDGRPWWRKLLGLGPSGSWELRKQSK